MAKQRIMRAAGRLFERGERPTVAEIATAAGVSRATFHRVIGSRADLVRELDVEPEEGARQRVLATALELVGRGGLEALSMDELAVAAQVSRAGLYRMFPGKSALFRELVASYSPMETVTRTMDRLAGRRPEEVMPELARTVAGQLNGRMGLLLGLVSDMLRMAPDTGEAVEFAFGRGILVVVGYIVGEMAEGRLRRMQPILALQLFVGPIFVHLLTRPLVEARLRFEVPLEDAVSELALGWVRAMRPDPA